MNPAKVDNYNIFEWARLTNDTSAIVPAFVDWLIASPTVENVLLLRQRVGDEGVGVISRGMAEKLLGRTENGEYDFEHFSQCFKQMPEAFLKALFGSHYERLKDIAVTSSVIFPRKI